MKTAPPDIVLRPVRESDIDALVALAASAQKPITTFPPRKDYLTRRVHDSIRSFYPHIDSAGAESYLFVLENTKTNELLGTSCIFARVGGYEPFYSYHVKPVTLEHAPLGIKKTISELQLHRNYDGPSEIGTLYLSPKIRGTGLAYLLSFARFLFLAQFPQRFASYVIAEMRGFSDASGRSPFWDAVGSHFFGCDYMTADKMSARRDKSFIHDLMPRNPIYVSLLPQSAREVIGEVHPHTQPARILLEKQGFRYEQEVDIFDAGPILHAKSTNIHAVQHSRPVEVSSIHHGSEKSPLLGIVTTNDLCFRAILTHASHTSSGLCLPAASAKQLGIHAGDTVRWYPLPTQQS